MKKIIYLFIVILLCGCSPQKRIVRIAEKYNLKQFETVVFYDTIIIPEKIYMFQTAIDSTGKFHQNINGNEVFGIVKDSIVTIKVVVKSDTVYIEKPIAIETIKVEKIEKKNGILCKLLWFIIPGVFAFVLFKYLKNRK